MTLIKIAGGPPECPLCGKRMREIISKIRNRPVTIYCCFEPDCMVNINKNDPCCGHWLDRWPESAPKCPLCGDAFRWFFRLDGYKKLQCKSDKHKGRIAQIVVGKIEDMPKEMGGGA